jgi:hypothetical protein
MTMPRMTMTAERPKVTAFPSARLRRSPITRLSQRRDRDDELRIEAEDHGGARDARELGHQRSDVGEQHRAERDPCPAESVMLANQSRVAFSRHDAKPHRHLLHDEERQNEQYLQQDELVTELRAGGNGRRDAARFRIGEHDDEPRSEHREKLQQPAPGVKTQRSSGNSRLNRRHRS